MTMPKISTPTDNRNQIITISFGKVTYEPGAPKGLPRWAWRCLCEHCVSSGALHGPFKTRREAEQDAEQIVALAHDAVHGPFKTRREAEDAEQMIALAQVEDGTHH
jgi:hypothetical protein